MNFLWSPAPFLLLLPQSRTFDWRMIGLFCKSAEAIGLFSGFKKTSCSGTARLFRLLSAVFLSLAFCAAVALVAIRLVVYFWPRVLPWTLMSAVSLILIGVAFVCFQFAVRRTRIQIVLGLAVSAAFILWGAEQFVRDRALASLMDDVVVFLFVLDLSLVIYGHLKSASQRAGEELPLDTPNE